MKLILIVLTFFSFGAFAVDKCSDVINQPNIGYGDGQKDLVTYSNGGKLEVNKNHPDFKSYKREDNKEIITFKYKLSNGSFGEGRKEYLMDSEKITVRAFFDSAMEKKAGKSNPKNSEPTLYRGGNTLHRGNESIFSRGLNDTCELVQLSSIVSPDYDMKKTLAVVTYDKKTCDYLTNLIQENGKDGYNKCEDLFTKIYNRLNDRSAEIYKEGKYIKNMQVMGWPSNAENIDGILSTLKACKIGKGIKNSLISPSLGSSVPDFGVK